MQIKTERGLYNAFHPTHVVMCDSDGTKFPIAAGSLSDMIELEHTLKANNPEEFLYWIDEIVEIR